MRNKYLFLLTFLSFLGVVPGAAHALLPIQTWQTASGARVYFVENRSLPTAAFAAMSSPNTSFTHDRTSGTERKLAVSRTGSAAKASSACA